MKVKVIIYRDRKGEYRWRMKRGGRIVADSGEGYVRLSGAVRAVSRLVSALNTTDNVIYA
jgi:uncharacterized protein YegP (UPF0339 family)